MRTTLRSVFYAAIASLPQRALPALPVLLPLLAAIMATACTETPEARRAADAATPVTLSVSAAAYTAPGAAPTAPTGAPTRAPLADAGHADRTFAAGEQLYAYFPEGVSVGHTVFTTAAPADNKNAATAADPQPMLSAPGGTLPVYAYSPATVTEQTATWTVAQNQATAERYTASDLMTATGTIDAQGCCKNAVNGSSADALTLQHQMARIVVSVTAPSAALSLSALQLIAGWRTTGLAMPAGTPAGALTDAISPAEPLTVSAAATIADGATQQFCCLVPPQRIAQGTPLVRIVTHQGTVTYATATAQQLQAGRSYTLAVSLTAVGVTTGIAAWATENVPSQESDEDLYEVGGVTFRMVPVEGGTMRDMYSDQITKTYTSGVNVTLSDYKIAQTECTQQLWQAVTGSVPSAISAANKGDQKPVSCISWLEVHGGKYNTSASATSAVAWTSSFLYKLNKATKTQRPDGWVFALPTHAQWEYAARGGQYDHGYAYSGSDVLVDVAWCKESAGSSTHDVGTKAPNELGLYDMHGNVFEYCADWKYISADTGTLPAGNYTDPAGPVTPSAKRMLPVTIGGDYNYSNNDRPQYYKYNGGSETGETGSAGFDVVRADNEGGFRVALMPLRQAIMPCHIGWVLTSEGNLYQTAAQATADGETPVAMIAYVATGTEGNGPTKTNASEQYTAPYTHGLAIALTNCATDGSAVDNAAANLITTPGTNADNLHAYVGQYKPTAPKGTSGWIVPTAYQWMRMLNGCGSTTAYTVSTDVTTFLLGNINTLLGQHTGAVQLSTVDTGTNVGRYYSSTCDGTFGSTSDRPAEYRAGQPAFGCTNNCYLRPILAF